MLKGVCYEKGFDEGPIKDYFALEYLWLFVPRILHRSDEKRCWGSKRVSSRSGQHEEQGEDESKEELDAMKEFTHIHDMIYRKNNATPLETVVHPVISAGTRFAAGIKASGRGISRHGAGSGCFAIVWAFSCYCIIPRTQWIRSPVQAHRLSRHIRLASLGVIFRTASRTALDSTLSFHKVNQNR